MSKSTTVRALMEPGKKKRVGEILQRLGMNHSEAINIFYSLIEEFKGIPFNVQLPDNSNTTETETVIRPEVIKNLKESMKKNRRLGELLAK